MKTETLRHGAAEANGARRAKRVTVKGKHKVVSDQAEYDRLLQKADEWEPPMPEPNERGNYPVEVLDVLLARKFLRRRRAVGLSQAELAGRASIRLKTLDNIEKANRCPSVRIVDKIDRALREAEEEDGH